MWLAGASLALVLCGCFPEERKSLLVPTPLGNTPQLPSTAPVAHAPATEAVARRVLVVSRKVLEANRGIGMNPAFITAGTPQPEIFHQPGKGTQSGQIVISEGLVQRCKTDGQLAAILCQELGKMVAEREALVPGSTRMPGEPMPIYVPVGNDAGGVFGSPDGTRMMELAKYEQSRRTPDNNPPPPPTPEVLARTYLTQAGYSAAELTDVLPLLRQAEQHNTVEKTLGQAAAKPAGR
jgi:hypothetical protein